MVKCKYKFPYPDGQICGSSTGGFFCETHRREDITQGYKTRIREYVKEQDQLVLDFSGLSFRGFEFNQDIIPDNRSVKFDAARLEDCQFKNLTLGESPSFYNCELLNCLFDHVSFSGATVDFRSAVLDSPYAPFIWCVFEVNIGILMDTSVIKCSGVPFRWCYMSALVVEFAGCSLDVDSFRVRAIKKPGSVRYADTLLVGAHSIDFSRLGLSGHFEYSNDASCLDYEPFVQFSNINFKQMNTAAFIGANLRNAGFTQSILSTVEFRSPIWRETVGRHLIHDEYARDENTDEEELRDTYIQLKKNYESAHNYIDAGHWFYREMECRRRLIAINRGRVVRWFRQNFFAFSPLYRYTSSYGENHTRPLWMIALVLLVFATIYFYWTGYPSDSGSVRYEFALEWNDGAFGDFFGAVAFSTGVMLLQSVKLAMDQPSPTPIISVVQVVFTLILVPLFLLALRRKFRR